MLETVRVFAIAAVFGSSARLNVCSIPSLGTNRAQRGRGMKRSCAHFHVIGLEDDAALRRPVLLERQDEILEGFAWLKGRWRVRSRFLRGFVFCHCAGSIWARFFEG